MMCSCSAQSNEPPADSGGGDVVSLCVPSLISGISKHSSHHHTADLKCCGPPTFKTKLFSPEEACSPLGPAEDRRLSSSQLESLRL